MSRSQKGCAWSHEPSQLPNGACGRILGIFKKHGSGEHSAHECPLRLNMLKGKNLSGLSQHRFNARPRPLNQSSCKTPGFSPAEMFSACIALSN